MIKHKKNIIILSFLFLVMIYVTSPYLVRIKLENISNSSLIYDSNNIEIWEINSKNGFKHINLELKDYPDFLKKIVVNIEDKRFYYHNWIDYVSIFRAFFNNILWYKKQWASTIETQIIKNNNIFSKKETQKRWYSKKIIEFLWALNLDKNYKKDELLQIYLNDTPFSSIYYWFASASRNYYKKDIKDTSKAEMIWLLTIINNPIKYSPISNYSNFRERFVLITNSLAENKIISNEEKKEILDEKLNYSWNFEQKLPYINDFLKNNFNIKSSKIQTTIDYNLSKKIDDLAKTSINKLAWKNVWDYWIIIIDKKTMELKVMIWWVNYDNKNGQVNSTTSLRQPWSALKPFIYLKSFKDLWKTPSSTILDLPVQFLTNDWNVYSPKNYSLNYAWEVSLAESLSQSLNIPAVKLLNELWIDNFLNFLKKLEFTSINKSWDYYWLSLALWSAEVNLFELTKAYWIFANDWKLCEVKIITQEKDKCSEIIEKKYTDMVYEILSNRYFKLKWFALNSNLDFEDKEVFVKTWTSRNYKDNWTIWFTKDYLIWVWSWNKDWSEMMWVSWVSWAWEIFKNIVYELDKSIIVPKTINLDTKKTDYLEIISPLNESVYKIDNSIPIEKQNIKLEFKTNIKYDSYTWILNWNEIKNEYLNIKNLEKTNTLEIILKKENINIFNQKSHFEVK